MYLASGGDAVRLYGTEEYHLHQKYKPLTYSKKKIERDVGWSHNGKFFGIIVDGDPTVEIAHLGETMKPYESFQVSDPSALAFPKNSSSAVAIGTKSGIVHTLNYINKKALISFPSCNIKITTMDYSFNDTSIAAGTVNGKIIICGIQCRQIMREFNLPTPQVISSVKFHHSRKGILAVGSHDGHVTVWDTNFNSVDSKFADHTAQCTGVVFSPLNRHFMATVGFDYLVFCYDMRAKRQVLQAKIPAAGSSLDVHKNGNILAVSTVAGTICIFDLRNTRAPLKQIITNGRTVKLMYQLEPEESRKHSAGKASSLERLVHKRNSNEALRKTPCTSISENPVSITEDSQSSDDSSGADNIFSPVGVKSPEKLAQVIDSISTFSASKIMDMKTLSFVSSKKGSPGDHSLSCNNSEEFATGLLKVVSKAKADFPPLRLGSITETVGEETRFLNSAEGFSSPQGPQMVMQNGHTHFEGVEKPDVPREMEQNSPEEVQNCEFPETPLRSNQKFVSVSENDTPTTPVEHEDELSEVDTSDLLNKYSMTKGLGKEFDVSNSMNSSDNFSWREKEAVAKIPQEVLSSSPLEKESIERVEVLAQPLEEVKDEACAVSQVPCELMSSLKEHLDAKLLEQSDAVYTNLSKMHLFNIMVHSKHEVMLEKILKILEGRVNIEKEDKCVGTC